MGLRPLSCFVVACVAILTGGCSGGGGEGSSASVAAGRETVTRLTDEWVSMYCSDSLELLVFLVDTRDGTLAGDVTPEEAGRILSFRAENFVAELNRVGRPDSPMATRERARSATWARARRQAQTASPPGRRAIPRTRSSASAGGSFATTPTEA